jgi:molybdopterin molybdotransferase
MQAAVRAVTRTEVLPLAQLLDRINAEPITAGFNVPGYDNSAMDGYALCADAASEHNTEPLTLVGQSLAGHAYHDTLKPGQCVRITTGATVPAGANAVVMQENTRAQGEQITVLKPPSMGENIRRAGEDIRQGTTIFAPGHRFTPVDIALLASLGLAHVKVMRRLKIAVLSTGDELTPPGQPLPEGHIYDSNRYGIIAMLTRLNAEVIDLGLIPDQPERISAAFTQAAAQADAVITSGGVSVGDADYVKDILTQQGHINFWKVAIKPGKPFAFGRLNNAVFFGLPGNPVAAIVTLHQLALPVLLSMAGGLPEPALTLTTEAQQNYKKRPGRCDYQRARVTAGTPNNPISSTGAQGSGVLTSFIGANAYAVLEAERGPVAAGEPITAIAFDRFLR